MFNGAVDDECSGSYWVGIMPVSSLFLMNSDRYVATEHMLFREFRENDTEACRRPGSEISEVRAGCWDSWAVRIRDSSGRLITKDFPPADASVPADGGAGSRGN